MAYTIKPRGRMQTQDIANTLGGRKLLGKDVK